MITDPAVIVDALIAAGWQVVGERAGLYKRLALVHGAETRLTFFVPLDPTYGDYDDLMRAVIQTLERMLDDGRSAQQVLGRIQPGVYL